MKRFAGIIWLPVVDRELRVAARRSWTYWGRFSAAATAMVIFGGMLLLALVSGGTMFKTGGEVFQVLKWMVFLLAAGAGAFLTGDCLSEEKREGTLGLLFLTDLRGHDVVLGKLITHSAMAAWWLVASFPVIGLALLLGGVTGTEFGRMTLAVANTLFFTLALGLMVSSGSREGLKAVNGALLLTLFFLGGLPLLDLTLAAWDPTRFEPRFSLASPAYLVGASRTMLAADFWRQLVFQHALGWSFLLVAIVVTPRFWPEGGAREALVAPSLVHRWRYGGPRARRANRARWLAEDPLLWLALRDRWLARLVAGVFLTLGVALGLIILIDTVTAVRWEHFALVNLVQVMLFLAINLWVTAQAVGFFADGVRQGAFELILVTLVTPAQIVRQQWRALWRVFRLPLLVCLGLQILSMVLMFRMQQKSAVVPGNLYSNAILNLVIGLVTMVTGLAAVGGLGMWLGLTSRQTWITVLKTLALAQVVPTVVIVLLQLIFIFLSSGSSYLPYLSEVLGGALSVAKDFYILRWSRRQLLSRFREVVANRGERDPSRSRRAASGCPGIYSRMKPGARIILLPVVGRELSVAARKPLTYRLRYFAALGAMGLWLLAVVNMRGQAVAAAARDQFDLLSAVALGFCLAAGMFLTADSLSAEKRDGTLGLLFLTDLRGYDVVLGKLAATSLQAAFALLSVMPVLALPRLMGGVTAGEFWRLSLVLVVALFFSLAAGMASWGAFLAAGFTGLLDGRAWWGLQPGLLLWAGFSLLLDLGLAIWAWQQLRTRFHDCAAGVDVRRWDGATRCRALSRKGAV